MKKALMVYNPAAGRFPSGLLAERAADVLRAEGWEIRLEQTMSGDHIPRLARRAAEEGLDGFLVIGGDGSLNLALPDLLGSNTALGVLPAGTGNVWAQEIGLPGLSWTRWMALDESAHLLARSEVRTIDVGLCNGRPFLLWAGAGLDGFIVHRIEPRSRWEKHFAVVQYAASAVWNASFWRGVNLSILAEGQKINGHYLMALVSNVHLYGGGLMQLTPNARLNDGLMDLWLFEGDTLGDTVQHVWDLLSGRHLQSGAVSCYPFRTLALESDATLFVQMDGEPVERDGPISIQVLPQALRVFIPPTSRLMLFEEQPYPDRTRTDQTVEPDRSDGL